MKTGVFLAILICVALVHAAHGGAASSDFEKYAVRSSIRSNGANRLKWRKLAALPTCVNMSLCGSLCVDLLLDSNNCGECGKFCDLTATCCGGLCTNLQSSNDHCGACGARCPGECAAGVCNYGGATGGGGAAVAAGGGISSDAAAAGDGGDTTADGLGNLTAPGGGDGAAAGAGGGDAGGGQGLFGGKIKDGVNKLFG